MRQTARRAATLAVPIVVDLVMPGVYRRLARRLGSRRGYIAGFVVYWGACLAIPTAILGPRRASKLLTDARAPQPLEVFALALPPLGGLAAETLPAVRSGVRVDGPVLAAAAAFATTNAVAEEMLWRGLFLAVFPRGGLAGWIYPAVGFGLWHRAPQEIHPASRPFVFVLAAGVLGLVNGWIVRRLGGIRAATISHALADATGIGVFTRMLARS